MLNPNIKYKLSHNDYNRYARQITIEEISIQGQSRLKQAKILCIGAGGLNAPALLYLAACGIGTIGIIDHDIVEISNLQRQIIYNKNDIKTNKAQAAFNTLKSLNPYIKINSYNKYLEPFNIRDIIFNYDIIIDGTDNFEIRYLISEYCYLLHKIHIYGAIEKFTGQVSVFNYQNGSHYYNLHKNITKLQNCNESGIINTLAGLIGTLQATEAIKIILGLGSILSEYLLILNILKYSLNTTKIKRQKIAEKIIIKSNQTKKRYIDINTLINNHQESYHLIDVRTTLEFRIKYIEKAINIPLNILKQKKSIKLLKNIYPSIIVLYCDNENRSYIASQILYRHSIEHYILQGGINSIKKERDSNPR